MEAVTALPGEVLAYTIGVDIGQARDPTAIAVVEVRDGVGALQTDALHITRFLERLPLGTPYPKIGERLRTIIQNAYGMAHEAYFQEHGRCQADDWNLGFPVYIDGTGVGRPVVDILRGYGLNVTPVYFTHGDRRKVEADHITMGKAWMVSRLKVLFQTQAIRLPPTHPEAVAMRQELLDYEIRVDQNANDKYGAFRVGAHDDLVTALGLAVQDADLVRRIHQQRELHRAVAAMTDGWTL